MLWVEDGKSRVKLVDPELDDLLCEALDKGDTLKQIFRIIEVKERQFARTPEPGKIPLWVKEWEDANYEINFFPPSFPDWAQIVDD